MKKKSLLRTNIWICVIIVLGFVVTSAVIYRLNFSLFERNIEQVSTLAARGVYDKIDSIFAAPVNVSLTLANDSLLKAYLTENDKNLESGSGVQTLQEYLETYRKHNGFDTVFLVSSATSRYYNDKGKNQVLNKEDAENKWYFEFLQSPGEYSLNVDKNEVSGNVITVFVNSKIKDKDGSVIGVVGAGMRVDQVQSLLQGYEEQYQLKVHLVDGDGLVQVSSNETGYDTVHDLFHDSVYSSYKDKVLTLSGQQTFWYCANMTNRFVVSQYIPALGWYLVVENDTSFINYQLISHMVVSIIILFVIVLVVQFLITRLFKKYSDRIASLTVSQELEYEQLLRQATEGLYGSIYEFNLTENRAYGINTVRFFESLGLTKDTPFDKALPVMAKNQVSSEFRKGYLDTFSPDHVKEVFNRGVRSLTYDFTTIPNEYGEAHWIRITARIFLWESDQSLRMISYRANIDHEKNLEAQQQNISQELEYQNLLAKATGKFYENIFELDITHRRACGASTIRYFESLGMSADTPYDEALGVIAHKQIKEEFIDGYLTLFAYDNIMAAYNSGTDTLTYDFMILRDDQNYHWIRITARIFLWESDNTVRMITYREDIDEEKKREKDLLDRSQKDPLTNLYNKRVMEKISAQCLAASEHTESEHALLIIDIDDFKTINDQMGHAFGDVVIMEFAAELKRQFRDTDILGRIGGDEFAVLMKNCGNPEIIKEKLERICFALAEKDYSDKSIHISCSIGAAVFPDCGASYADLYEKADQALYYAKGHGKNTFQIYGEISAGGSAFHINQRDFETLISTSTDGVSKVACCENFKLLYFNQRRTELTGTTAKELSDPDFDVLGQIHPDDLHPALAILRNAMPTRSPFSVNLRLKHEDGHYILVRLRGIFVSELYEGKYPIFYAIYTNLEDTALPSSLPAPTENTLETSDPAKWEP